MDKENLAEEKVPESLNVRLRAPEQRVIKRMHEAGLVPNELIRGFLRQYGEEHFKEDPAYAQAALLRAKMAHEKHLTKKAVEEMTDEEYAKNVLKAVVVGGKAYLATISTFPWFFQVSDAKKYSPTDQGIKTHIAIMEDGVVTDPWGEEMYPDDKEEARRKVLAMAEKKE